MTPTESDLHWLAGLLEGEGTFLLDRPDRGVSPGSLKIALEMTDQDVVKRAASLLGGPLYGPYVRESGRHAHAMTWSTAVQGRAAWNWMLTLQPLMGGGARRGFTSWWASGCGTRCGGRWRRGVRRRPRATGCGT